MNAHGYTITSERELRRAFWRDNPHLQRRKGKQNDQPTDTRCAWVDWVDAQARGGSVSERIAQNATL